MSLKTGKPTATHNIRSQFWLSCIGQSAPIFSQLGIMVLMVLQGNWLYTILLTPGLIATSALSISNLMTSLKTTHSINQHSDEGVSEDSTAYPLGSMNVGAPLNALPPVKLQDIVAGHEAVSLGGFLWQGIIHHWLINKDPPKSSDSKADEYYLTMLGSSTQGGFCLNLPKQGPHALVAGTTGSGKSVLLQDWCLSLDCKLPPQCVNFIFLDFKGGSAFNLLSKLPHCVGSVSDLNLETSVRAIKALELELKRREQIVADQGVTSFEQLDDPPARLLVVIDEFQALRQQLPDYMDHLVQLASLGRSLGIHLIVCSQSTLGQVSTQMKANMNLNISLRVRDTIQSNELLGSNCAALISPNSPGLGFYTDGEQLTGFYCASCEQAGEIIRQIEQATRFCMLPSPCKLFTAPLPQVLSSSARLHTIALAHWECGKACICLGLSDDGVELYDCLLTLEHNLVIIGGPGRGKSNLIGLVLSQLKKLGSSNRTSGRDIELIYGRFDSNGYHEQSYSYNHCEQASSSNSSNEEPMPPCHTNNRFSNHLTFWLLDDADELLDPLNQDPLAQRLHLALNNPEVQVVISLKSIRRLREPDQFPYQIIFPSGQRAEDVMAGIPPKLLQTIPSSSNSTPGRAILLNHGQATILQCSQK